tara:strand:- start:489 stop:1028 length:540 start_codon:yes stop_codon:yes gene_type:complete
MTIDGRRAIEQNKSHELHPQGMLIEPNYLVGIAINVNGSQMTVEEQQNERVTYCGIADAHGIESFQKKDTVGTQGVFIMQMRAGLNRQRHAVYYEVDIRPKDAEVIMGIIKGKQNRYEANGIVHSKYAYALLWLKDKDVTPEYGVAAQGCSSESLFNSWDLIPDPRLDPWGGDYSDSEE